MIAWLDDEGEGGGSKGKLNKEESGDIKGEYESRGRKAERMEALEWSGVLRVESVGKRQKGEIESF